MAADIYSQEYEKVRRRLICRLVSCEGGGTSLRQIPHRFAFADLEVVPCLREDRADGNSGCLPLPDTILKRFGMESDRLIDDAAANMRDILPPRLYRMADLMCSRMDGSARNVLLSLLLKRFPDTQEEVLDEVAELLARQFGDQLQKQSGLRPMWVLSNDEWLYGASGLLFHSVLEQFSHEYGCGFYILPSSVNEVIFLPEGGTESPDQLQELVLSANRLMNNRDNFLSDSVYYYDIGQRNIRRF